MKNILFLCLVIILFGCSKNNKLSDKIIIDDTKIINDNIEIQEIKNIELKDGEEKLEYFGVVLNSIINNDNVNIYSYPSLNSKILFTLDKNTKIVITGVSKEIDEIDNFIGNWLNIRIGNHWSDEGWVFSKYAENGLISASEIKIIELRPKEEGRAQGLIAVYDINGYKKNITLYPNKEENQNFYTFAYDWSIESFHYSNIPGSYAWFPETNELRHITYWN